MPSTHERHLRRGELDTLEDLRDHLARDVDLRGWVVHAVDLRGFDDWQGRSLEDVLFLGCTFEDTAQRHRIEDRGAYVFPEIKGLPYDPWRATLYSVDELLEGWDEGGYAGTRDFRIYAHFDRARRQGWGVSIRETLAQRIHDHAIDDALAATLSELPPRSVVGVMGGHSTRRDDRYYRKVAHMCWELTRRGYFIASGGGPGIMEAANLGAYLACWGNPRVVDAALEVLGRAPKFDGGHAEGTRAYLGAIGEYVRCAREVTERFGPGTDDAEMPRAYALESETPGQSLAIPTWFYGHEPTNLFSTHVAKYFSNSIREDGLLAISLAGVVFAPGSAGTLQEVFMDLAQNHYATFDWRSPMVFLGRERFESTHALIQEFVAARGAQERYGDLITLLDDPLDVVEFIEDHPPRERALSTPLYELIEESP